MKKEVQKQLGAALWAFRTNTEGVTHRESLIAVGGGNCLNWVGGHLVATYSKLLAALGAEPVWSEEQAHPYRRGSEPLGESAEVVDFGRIREDLAAATERTMAAIENLSAEDLAAPAPFSPMSDPDETVSSLLVLIAFHQAYHAGQSGVLRRAAGKNGAIR